jgi:hypothetical protein
MTECTLSDTDEVHKIISKEETGCTIKNSALAEWRDTKREHMHRSGSKEDIRY